MGDEALITAAASALCMGEAAAGKIGDARKHHAEAVSYIDRLSDAGTGAAPGGAVPPRVGRNYLEFYDQAIAHVDRGIAIGRATGRGRMVVR